MRQLLLLSVATLLASPAAAAPATWVHLPEVAEGLPQAPPKGATGPLAAAIERHRRAAAARRKGDSAGAKALYRQAAAAYHKHEKWRSGQLKSAVRYAYAYALYFSGDYGGAVVEFTRLTTDKEFAQRIGSYYGVVRAREHFLRSLARSGSATYPPLPGPLTRPYSGEMPKAAVAYLQALDAFVAAAPKDKRAPLVAYRAGELLLRYGRLAQARKRLETVHYHHCRHAVAAYALQALVRSYQIARNKKQLIRWAKVLAKGRCGGKAAAAKLQRRGHDLLLRERILLARDAVAKAKKQKKGKKRRRALNHAAKLFLRALAAHPQPPTQLAAQALFDAGLAYMNGHSYQKAIATFSRVVKRYGDSRLAEYAKHNIAAIRSAL